MSRFREDSSLRYDASKCAVISSSNFPQGCSSTFSGTCINRIMFKAMWFSV